MGFGVVARERRGGNSPEVPDFGVGWQDKESYLVLHTAARLFRGSTHVNTQNLFKDLSRLDSRTGSEPNQGDLFYAAQILETDFAI
jgi:hypothetical protein